MTDPFREQRLNPEEVRRIVKRAVELAERDPDTAATAQSLTREELEQAAATLGIPASAIAKAAGPEEEAVVPARSAKPSLLLGAPRHIHLETALDAVPRDADREELVEIVRGVLGQVNVETVGRALTWSQYGTVHLRSRGGRTRPEAEVLSDTGFLAFLLVGLLAALFTLMAAMGAVSWTALVWFLPAFLLARILFMAWVRKAERTVRRALRAITKHAEGWSPRRAPARIAVPDRVEAEDAEAEAEAEAEAAERSVRRRRR